MGYIGAPTVEPLVVALNDRDSYVRQGAVEALGKTKDPRAVEPLISALKSRDSSVRRAAAAAISEFKDPRVVSSLLAAWNERDTFVIAGAAYFFIERGASGSEDLLNEALSKSGDKEMAEKFINCGNPKLEKVARVWAFLNGYAVSSGSSGTRSVAWGGGR